MWIAGWVTRPALRDAGGRRHNSQSDRPGSKASAGSDRLRDGFRSKLPTRMDGNEPAEDRLDLGLLEAGRADHPLEFGHRREAADRFDQVAIAVLVMRNRLADPRHDLVRVVVVGVLESRPLSSREFEAEESAAELEDAERLGQCPVYVGDVPDTEGDGVGIEAAVRIG